MSVMTNVSVDQIKKAVIEAGSDHSEMFGFAEFEDGLHLQQEPQEYAEFVHYMATEMPTFELALDIGVASGGQTKFLRDYCDIKRTIVVDIGEHPKFPHWDRIKQSVNSEIVLELIDDSHSQSVHDELQQFAGQVDFAFIDGDHSYTGLKQDLVLAKTVTKEGAIYALHDTLAVPDCARVFDEMKRSPDFELLQNFDRRFGISVWRYTAAKGPVQSWTSKLIGRIDI